MGGPAGVGGGGAQLFTGASGAVPTLGGEDETPVEEDKESPRIQEIDEDADNSPPIIKDVDSDEEDSPVESKANPVNSSPIILDLDGSSRNTLVPRERESAYCPRCGATHPMPVSWERGPWAGEPRAACGTHMHILILGGGSRR
eukprot:scaffold25262_cov118-Isochrysis_galbana.AAC.1